MAVKQKNIYLESMIDECGIRMADGRIKLSVHKICGQIVVKGDVKGEMNHFIACDNFDVTAGVCDYTVPTAECLTIMVTLRALE